MTTDTIAEVIRNYGHEVYDWAGLHIRELVISDHDPGTTRVLDVGARQGKYRALLPEYTNVDACEIWEPYVERHNLRALYRRVHVRDIYDLVVIDDWHKMSYDVVILGDVLEHLPRDRAQEIITVLCMTVADVITVVPYNFEQDEEDGNPYQRHIQDDLTPELMTTAYPDLRLLAVQTHDRRPFKGLYRGGVAWSR